MRQLIYTKPYKGCIIDDIRLGGTSGRALIGIDKWKAAVRGMGMNGIRLIREWFLKGYNKEYFDTYRSEIERYNTGILTFLMRWCCRFWYLCLFRVSLPDMWLPCSRFMLGRLCLRCWRWQQTGGCCLRAAGHRGCRIPLYDENLYFLYYFRGIL